MKNIMASLLMLCAGSVAAESSCRANLDSGVRISVAAIEFFEGDKTLYRISGDQQLWVDGRALKLSAEQQRMVSDYAANIRALVPEVKEIALGAVAIAQDAVVMLIDEFIGQDNKVSRQLSAELTHVKGDIEHYFSTQQPISFDEQGNGSLDVLGQHFETRIARVVETSVQDSIGSFALSMIKEIFSSAGNMEKFEQRMNRFGEQVDERMQARALVMEQRGQALCESVIAIDTQEENLKLAIPAVQKFNVINVTGVHLAQKI